MIRLPSHFCGIAGIKPTSGRVPRTGHIVPGGLGALDALTQIGPMARFVEDLVLVLPIIAGVDWQDSAIVPMPLGDPEAVDLKGLRIAVYTNNGIVTPTAETEAAVKGAAQAAADAGIAVEENRPPALAQVEGVRSKLSSADGRTWVCRLLERAGTTDTHPWIQGSIDKAEPIGGAEYSALLEDVDRARSEMLSFMRDYDAIICPVSPYPALPHETWRDEEQFPGIASYTGTYNLTGWPGAVVRAGGSPEGLPIGVQVVARPWREDVALAVAGCLELALGGWQRPPA